MEGLAKSASTVNAPVISHSEPANGTMGNNLSLSGVPLGVFSFYDKRFGGEDPQTMHQMKTVYDYVKTISDGQTEGDIMLKLREIDSKMGTPKIGESRLGRAFNYARLTGMINNLDKQRQALTGI